MQLYKKIAATAGTTFTTLSMTAMALAQSAPSLTVDAESAGFESELGKFVQVGLNTVLLIAAVLVLLYLVWGGIQWITSGGDKGKTEEARNKITAAVIGLAVVAASYAIFRVVLYVLGINNPFSGDTTALPSLKNM